MFVFFFLKKITPYTELQFKNKEVIGLKKILICDRGLDIHNCSRASSESKINFHVRWLSRWNNSCAVNVTKCRCCLSYLSSGTHHPLQWPLLLVLRAFKIFFCCQIYFKEVERREIAYCICNFLPSLLMFQGSFWYHFSFV